MNISNSEVNLTNIVMIITFLSFFFGVAVHERHVIPHCFEGGFTRCKRPGCGTPRSRMSAELCLVYEGGTFLIGTLLKNSFPFILIPNNSIPFQVTIFHQYFLDYFTDLFDHFADLCQVFLIFCAFIIFVYFSLFF